MPHTHHTSLLGDYRIRIMLCMAAALLLMVGAVQLWPPPDDSGSDERVYIASERDVIEIEEIQPTSQAQMKPPPPSPPIPILVPDETVLEEEDLDFSDQPLAIEEPADDRAVSDAGTNESDGSPAGPTVGPKTVRFVEPEYTREARRNRVRAELVVSVTIDERGQVEAAEIVERFLLDKDGASKTPVSTLGYGLEEAALSAADRWVFRPARKDGRPVASRTTLTFTFGVDA